MDNLEFLCNEDSDGDDLFSQYSPYIGTSLCRGDGPETYADLFNDRAMQRMARHHFTESVAEGIVNQIIDESKNPIYTASLFREIKLSDNKQVSKSIPKTAINGEPYVEVDFTWRSGKRELDPNSMETSHIENAIKYVDRKIDSGDFTEMQGRRVIRGFKLILEARSKPKNDPIIENETYKAVKNMETPIISILDKSTGEVIDISNIPFNIILELSKKYGQ